MALITKPPWGSQVAENDILSPQFQTFFDELESALNANLLGAHVQLTIYTVATLPPVMAGGLIYVSNETGGATVAFSDGVAWRRMQDRAVVS